MVAEGATQASKEGKQPAVLSSYYAYQLPAWHNNLRAILAHTPSK